MHFVMYASRNHVEVLHNVTPIDLPAQSAVLSDRVIPNPNSLKTIYDFAKLSIIKNSSTIT